MYSLYEARILNRKTQEEIAKHLSISIPTWRNYEKGRSKKKIPADKLIEFCELVKLTPEKIDLTRE